jgi:hypothetical protein
MRHVHEEEFATLSLLFDSFHDRRAAFDRSSDTEWLVKNHIATGPHSALEIGVGHQITAWRMTVRRQSAGRGFGRAEAPMDPLGRRTLNIAIEGRGETPNQTTSYKISSDLAAIWRSTQLRLGSRRTGGL